MDTVNIAISYDEYRKLVRAFDALYSILDDIERETFWDEEPPSSEDDRRPIP